MSPVTLDQILAIAPAELAQKSGDAVVATLGYGLEHRDQSLPHALSYAENRMLRRYRQGIAVLDTVITLAPLLGQAAVPA